MNSPKQDKKPGQIDDMEFEKSALFSLGFAFPTISIGLIYPLFFTEEGSVLMAFGLIGFNIFLLFISLPHMMATDKTIFNKWSFLTIFTAGMGLGLMGMIGCILIITQ